MSTKPATVATWDTSLANLVAPTAGHKLSGYVVNEVPTSGELNGQLNLIGLWAQYLSDAVLTGGASVAGALAVTGGLTTDSAQVNGALGATGVVTFASSARQSVADTIMIGANEGMTTTAGPTLDVNGYRWVFGTSSGRLHYPCTGLRANDKIVAWRTFVQKLSTSGTIVASLRKFDYATQVETLINTATSSTGAGLYQLANTAAEVLNNAGAFYYVVVSGGGTTGDFGHHCSIDYIRP